MPRTKVIKPAVVDNSSEIEAMKKQLEAMIAQLAKYQMPVPMANSIVEEEVDPEDEENKIKISSDDYIKVMSLFPSQMNLTTQPKGKGKIFTFRNFGEVKRILYKDLVDIMENHPRFLEEFFFIILDKRVIRKHGLDEIYTKALTKENIEKIILGENQSDAVNLFKAANASQQKFIADMIIDKMVAGQPMDLNLLDRLSRIVGYNIAERAEEAKAFAQLKP